VSVKSDIQSFQAAGDIFFPLLQPTSLASQVPWIHLQGGTYTFQTPLAHRRMISLKTWSWCEHVGKLWLCASFPVCEQNCVTEKSSTTNFSASNGSHLCSGIFLDLNRGSNRHWSILTKVFYLTFGLRLRTFRLLCVVFTQSFTNSSFIKILPFCVAFRPIWPVVF